MVNQQLSERLFGSPVAAVGKSIRLNGKAFIVVGVVGGGFVGPERGIETDFWVPYGALEPLMGRPMEEMLSRRSTMHGNILVRGRAGASMEAVEEQITEMIGRIAQADNGSAPYLTTIIPRLYPGLATPPIIRPATYASLRILAGIVALVLLIACANVANLLLVRNIKCRGAVATRRALGASSVRIARQHLVQSLVLGLLGTLAGFGVGWLISVLFRGVRLMSMPTFGGLVLDRRVVLFGAAVSIVTTLLAGTVPAALASRFDLVTSLRQAGVGATRRFARLRFTLSAGQLAMSLALVVGALLLLRTVHNLYAVDTGIDMAGVSTLSFNYSRSLTPTEVDALHRKVLAAMETLPEVDGAAISPYGFPNSTILGRVALPATPPDQQVEAGMIPVTPGWFTLFRVQAVNGRTFRDVDWTPGAPARVVLTASLAHRLFGRTNVAGQTVVAGFGTPTPMEVVGVVGDMRSAYAPGQPEDLFFVTYTHASVLPLDWLTLLLRTKRLNPQTAAHIRSAVESVVTDEPVPNPVPLSESLGDIYSETRMFSQLLGLLAVLSVAMSTVGLYGTVAFAVSGRRREFGVRLALGSENWRLAGLVARQSASIIVVGTLLGMGGAYALAQILHARLFGVEPVDPVSYTAAVALFAVVVVVASWSPMRNAIHVDPVATLREE